MASAGVALSGCKNNGSASIGTEKLQDWMNELKIRDDKKLKRPLLWERHRNWAHNVMATGGKNGQPKQTVSYMAERTVGQG
ncbi:hypothetical protein U9M48_028814 [Paspalum notatum var. saurae]|uniref:Uncharacterized protein n=1 Tax=Paspalum notatum var. saurae TaxID=547442 RepID=A0AAQ3TXI7_PASNO